MDVFLATKVALFYPGGVRILLKARYPRYSIRW